MAIHVRVEERFRVGDRVALPIGNEQGFVGTVQQRTSPLLFKTPEMQYLVEFEGVPKIVAERLMPLCSCDQCARFARKLNKRNADRDALIAERGARCKSDGILPNGRLRIWLGKWDILNFTGKNRLPYFTL